MGIFSWIFGRKLIDGAPSTKFSSSDFDPEGSPFCSFWCCWARKSFAHEHSTFYFEIGDVQNVSFIGDKMLVGLTPIKDNVGRDIVGWAMVENVRRSIRMCSGYMARQFEGDLAHFMDYLPQRPIGIIIKGEHGFSEAIAAFESLVPSMESQTSPAVSEPAPAPSQPSDS